MPGIHTIISNNHRGKPFQESDFTYTLHEANFKVKIIINKLDCVTAISHYDGYPFSEQQHGDIQIILEGMIYNYSTIEIQTKLQEIAENFICDGQYKNLVKKFVESADGDYIVQIYERNKKKLLLFNDYFGRLASYYYCQNGLFVFSKELKTILKFIPKIELNRSGLTEFLMREYEFGKKTIFKNIFYLLPSQMIVIKKQSDDIFFELSNSTDFNFKLNSPFSGKNESFDYLKKVFFESLKNRIKTVEEKGYKIIADLSGGYDTRTILGGLSRFTKNVSYFTFEYIRDESPSARILFEKMGWPGRYNKLHFENKLDFQEIGSLIYKTDGLVNYYTTSICYKELQYLKSCIPEKTVRFGGLGGSDFMRKRFWPYRHSFVYGIKHGFYSNLPLNIACQITGLDYKTYEEELEAYFSSYHEESNDEKRKRFYYEYQNRFASGVAEERERMHFWTIQAMWSLDFERTAISRLPLDWTGLKYYIQYMKSIDPRLLQAPIFGSNIDLTSSLSVNWHEIKNKITKGNYYKIIKKGIIKERMPSLTSWYIHKTTRPKINNDYLFKILQFYYEKFNYTGDIFNFTAIKKNKNLIPQTNLNCILTVLIYLNEIKKRFGKNL